VIEKKDNEYILRSKDGSKILGKFDSLKAAKKREMQIKYFRYLQTKKGKK
jgi:hypothetical protein